MFLWHTPTIWENNERETKIIVFKNIFELLAWNRTQW